MRRGEAIIAEDEEGERKGEGGGLAVFLQKGRAAGKGGGGGEFVTELEGGGWGGGI
jgi:hypothetical protein